MSSIYMAVKMTISSAVAVQCEMYWKKHGEMPWSESALCKDVNLVNTINYWMTYMFDPVEEYVSSKCHSVKEHCVYLSVKICY